MCNIYKSNMNEIIFENETNEDIERVKTIITTPKNSVAFNRNFGIDFNIVDLPLNVAKNRLIVEYTEKIKKYMSNIEVKDIQFNRNQNGNLIAKVVVGYVT